METKTNDVDFLQKRRFLIVLPLLVVPFITLLFWAMGGGKAGDAQAQQQRANKGLNVKLPDAHLKDDKALDKLSYYEKAASDSAKREELMKSDPYYLQYKSVKAEGLFQSKDGAVSSINYNPYPSNGSSALNHSPYTNTSNVDPNEAKVYRKLEQLNTALSQATLQSNKTASSSDQSNHKPATVNSADIDRLEQLMHMTKEGSGGEDPEMKQLNAVMERILDIQHPERVKEKIRQTSELHKEQVFTVSVNGTSSTSTLLENSRAAALNNDTLTQGKLSYNGFYSLEEETDRNVEQQNEIPAAIYETQTLVDGSTVKLRLLDDIYISGVLIPKDHFLIGIATLQGERLNIKINSIRYKNSLLPVQLSVYDMDGMQGIYIPGAITRDVAKQSADRAVQGLDITTLNSTLGAQAARAGIEAAKTLLSKKAKLVKVTVKAGYQVLLLDEKRKTPS